MRLADWQAARVAISDLDRAILDFERSWWTLPGPKERNVRQRLGLSPTRYYKVLNELIDSPDALAYDPLVVRRLRLRRDLRRRARYEGRAADRPHIR